jgi:hypothetical protein
LAAIDRVTETMRELPELNPPATAWNRISLELDRQRRTRTAKQIAAAAAAVVVMAVVVMSGLGLSTQETPTVAESISTEPLDDLMAASRALETVLQSAPLQSPVLRPAEAARIVAIEDSIAIIDFQLASSDELPQDHRVALWSGRVELLDELVQVRGRAGYAGRIRRAIQHNEGSEL